MSDPFPPSFSIFFLYVEPILTYIGVWKSLSDPASYFASLVPLHLISPAPASALVAGNNATMAIRQLGSCYLLLANFGFLLLRPLTPTLRRSPAIFHAILYRYLAILAIGDLVHIGLTLYDLGYEGSRDIGRWNELVWGNVGITVLLFVYRSAWFLCYGGWKAKAE